MMADGWKCPRCGCCYAPIQWKCPNCGPITITSTGTGGDADDGAEHNAPDVAKAGECSCQLQEGDRLQCPQHGTPGQDKTAQNVQKRTTFDD